jgi:hypothetical protein
MERRQNEARQACQDVFHWYGSVVNINPALFNFVVSAYERLRGRGILLPGATVEKFEETIATKTRMAFRTWSMEGLL